jgi:hypothetical protein
VNQSLAAAGWRQLRRAEEAIVARLSRGQDIRTGGTAVND